MKRIVMLATLLAFVLGMAATASAADLVASGSFRIAAMWTDNLDFVDSDGISAGDGSEDDTTFEERVRTTFAFVANENLQGVLALEIGTTQFGTAGSDLGADDVVIEVKSAYINFVWPNTNVGVFMGVMPIALPGSIGGSPILDDDMAGVIVSAPILDNVSVLAGWSRLDDQSADLVNNDNRATTDNFLDAGFVIVPMDFDGVAVTPYMAAVWSGGDFMVDANAAGNFPGLLTQNRTGIQDEGEGLFITYAGLTFDITLLDPFNLSGAFHYGAEHVGSGAGERAGWLGEIALTYTGWDMVTPQLYFGYSTGEDGNSSEGSTTDAADADKGHSERLPQVSESYAVGSFWFGNDWFDGELANGDDQMGFWTVGLFLNDISFFEGLTHQINILYVQGTNDETFGSRWGGQGTYGSTLTEDDSLWEFDLNTTYQIYDELTAVVRLGYIDMDYDDDNWNEIRGGLDGADEDAAKLMIGFDYSF